MRVLALLLVAFLPGCITGATRLLRQDSSESAVRARILERHADDVVVLVESEDATLAQRGTIRVPAGKVARIGTGVSGGPVLVASDQGGDETIRDLGISLSRPAHPLLVALSWAATPFAVLLDVALSPVEVPLFLVVLLVSYGCG